VYEAMRRESPDFFIHSGDQIYADGPIKATAVRFSRGSIGSPVGQGFAAVSARV
jgi:alkaline phosphatase D